MRYVQVCLGLALLAGAAGCPEGSRLNLLRQGGAKNPMPTETPTKEDLVQYLNNNSANIPGITSDDVSLTCYAGGPVGIPVGAKLRAQGPRNFRMMARALGNDEVDLGSNDQEFWYWIRRGDPPYQFFCSYQALEEGKVKVMPFPFQPEWVLEAMYMGKYGPAEKYEPVVVEKEQLKLVEKTKSPQGVPVRKVIVFNARKAKEDYQPQITDFLLLDDATGKLICSAHIKRRQIIPGRGELPRELELNWPEAKMKLVLTINSPQVTAQIAPQSFVRTHLKNVPSYDLATGRIEGMQQAGGPKNH